MQETRGRGKRLQREQMPSCPFCQRGENVVELGFQTQVRRANKVPKTKDVNERDGSQHCPEYNPTLCGRLHSVKGNSAAELIYRRLEHLQQ